MQREWPLGDIGCLLVVFAIGAFLPLAIVVRHVFQWSGVSTGSYAPVGWVCLSLYGLAALFNFFLSVIRPWLHSRRDDNETKHVSGIPVVHSLFLLAAIVTLPPNSLFGMLMLLLLALDTGAAHWAAFAVASEFLPRRGE